MFVFADGGLSRVVGLCAWLGPDELWRLVSFCSFSQPFTSYSCNMSD